MRAVGAVAMRAAGTFATLAILTAQSEGQRLKSWRRPAVRHWHEPYDGQPVLLLALYQKGRLRDDTLHLLRAARAQGIYVMAVNSLRLEPADHPRDLIDHYTERVNFGRDFGSYRAGVLNLLGDPEFADCPRLVMMNDSVFACEARIPDFLAALTGTDCEVLGATENFEIEYHLGSFCISAAKTVLRHPRFARYWRRYRNSDLRPQVIKRGEMGLSRTLRACVTSDGQVRALYDAARFHEACRRDPKFLAQVLCLARKSDLTGWKRLSMPRVVNLYVEEHLKAVLAKDRIRVEASGAMTAPIREMRMCSVEDALSCISDLVGRDLCEDERAHFSAFVAAQATQVFMSGSQIHQNAAILLHMGLPIVKLDGLYRGMYAIGDVDDLLDQLSEAAAARLRDLLFRRPFGGETLTGWRRFAFFRGYI